MNNYVDNIIDETGQALALRSAKVPLNSMAYYTPTPSHMLEKVTPKAINAYGLAQLALVANDAYNGYNEAGEIFQTPSTKDRIAAGIANGASGAVFGVIPVDKAAIGLAQLLGSDATPVSAAEQAQKEANKEYMEKVRVNVLKQITGQE